MLEPVLESSRLPPTVPQALHESGVDGARVSSWGGCLARSLLWWRRLPLWSDDVDGLASRPTLAYVL
jgi:hypothetical protein